jgi:hypothetical protein
MILQNIHAAAMIADGARYSEICGIFANFAVSRDDGLLN